MFIITNIIGSVFWGFLAAVIVTLGVWLVCRAVSTASVRSPLAFVVLAALFLLVGAQVTMLTGACYAKDYVSDIGDYATSFVGSAGDKIDISRFDEYRQQLADEFPAAKPMLDQIDVTDYMDYVTSGGEGASGFLAEQANSMLNHYMLRRVLWLVGFVVVALLAIAFLPRRRRVSDITDTTDSVVYYDDY